MGIEDLLNQVEWHEIPQDKRIRTVDDKGHEVPVATHDGILKIANYEFKVFQLSGGQRDCTEWICFLTHTLRVRNYFLQERQQLWQSH